MASAGQLLAELQRAAAVRREARKRMADVNAEPDRPQPAREEARRNFEVTQARWSQLIRDAVAADHPVSDVARAAGVARPSLYRHLHGGSSGG